MKFITNKIKAPTRRCGGALDVVGGNNKFKFRKTIYKQLNLLLSKPHLLLDRLRLDRKLNNKGLPYKIAFYFNKEKFLKAETLVHFNEELTNILIKFQNSQTIKNLIKYFLVPIAPLTSKGLLGRMGGGKGKRSTYYYKYAKNTLFVVIYTEKLLESKKDYIKLSSMLYKLRKKYSYLTLHNIYI